MTANQINYMRYLEDQRHNKVGESQNVRNLDIQEGNLRVNEKAQQETARHNVVSEDISNRDLNEKIRHNVFTEGISADTLAEQRRHNVVGESQGWASINENIRHNVQTEGIQTRNVDELIRHNKADEGIKRTTNAINLGNMNANKSQAASAKMNAETNHGNMVINQGQLEEKVRTDKANEWIKRGEIAANTINNLVSTAGKLAGFKWMPATK